MAPLVVLGFNVASRDMYMVPALFESAHRLVDVRFYGGRGNFFLAQSSFRRKIFEKIVVLDDARDREYPPVNKTFAIYRALSTVERRDWYVRCDADTHVDVPALLRVLKTMDTSRPIAVGYEARGREYERSRLRLGPTFDRYLNGGACEALNARAIYRLRTRWHECRADAMRTTKAFRHSDVETSRCFSKHGVALVHHPDMRPLAFSKGSGPLHSSLDPCRPHRYVTMHPFKDPSSHLLLQSPDLCGLGPTASSASPSSSPLPAFVLSFHDNATRLPSLFRPVTTVRPLRVDVGQGFLTAGEVSYRHAMRRLLVLGTRYTHFAAFDDDVLFRRDFHAREAHIATSCAATTKGVFLLGAAVWNEQAWRSTHHVCPGVSNGTAGVYGSFATVWTRDAAHAAIAWIDSTEGMYPFDHVWPFLQHLRFPWTFAHPPLAIMDIAKVSSVDHRRVFNKKRYRIHRWGSPSAYRRW